MLNRVAFYGTEFLVRPLIIVTRPSVGMFMPAIGVDGGAYLLPQRPRSGRLTLRAGTGTTSLVW